MGSRQVIADLTSKIMEQSDGDEQHIDNGISNGKEDAEEEIEEDSYSIEQFDIVKTIGRGGFARVCLCLHKPTSQYFALKTLPSQETTKLKKIEHVNCEKEILQDIQHPFLIPLIWSSPTSNPPYLLFPYITGGRLDTYLKKFRKFSSATALFFSAEVVSALAYHHSFNIAHRDLKPKNILLDKEGHIVIIDFGFSKIINKRSSTMCGTPQYLAPEIIQVDGHDKAVDWWALGIIIYEMLVGFPPFFDDNPFLIHQKILNEKIKWPRKINFAAKDLIEKLLVRDKSKRLGSTDDGSEQVQNHKFFKTLDWEDVFHKRLKPPIVPKFNPACKM